MSQAQTFSHTGSFGWRVSTGEIVWSKESFRNVRFVPKADIGSYSIPSSAMAMRPLHGVFDNLEFNPERQLMHLPAYLGP